MPQPIHAASFEWLAAFGGGILVKVGFVLLVAWLVGLLGVYDVGSLVHVPLLVGLVFPMPGGQKAREATVARERAFRSPER